MTLLDFYRLLPNELIKEIVSYFSLAERAILLTLTHNKMLSIFHLKLHREIEEILLVEKCMYLAAREGENNQDLLQSMLEQYSALIEKLLFTRIDAHDTVRHFIKPISVYQYIYWVDDKCLHSMLEHFINQCAALKRRAHEQRKYINDNGLDFEMIPIHTSGCIDRAIYNSKYFDFQPLKDACDAYNTLAAQVIHARTWLDWSIVRLLWLQYGIEIAKAPVYVMQALCYEDLSSSRTTQFHNHAASGVNKTEHLVKFGRANPNLGIFWSVYKGQNGTVGWDGGWTSPGAGGVRGLDFNKIDALSQRSSNRDTEESIASSSNNCCLSRP